MKIEFIPSKEDFLQLQLFMASKSELVNRNRKKSRLLLPIAYVALGIIVIACSDYIFGCIFIALGIVRYFQYPGIQAKRYEKMYRKNVDENLANRSDKPVELTFGDEYIESKDYTGEAKLKISTIERADEVRDYCFLKFDSGVGLVIPFNQLSEKDSFIEYLKTMATDNGIPYETNLEWKWK